MLQPLTPATHLNDVDLGRKIAKATYEKRYSAIKTQLRELQLAYKFEGKRAIVVIEGWDAVGKGGVIRRMTSPLDPRGYQVWPIGAPTAEEHGEHYLQRFWRRLPQAGLLTVFDRSWYGRVLVERVEGLTARADWRRAFGEINIFEKMLTDDGVRIVKLFLHISAKTQRDRLRDRMSDPLECWKTSPSDVRNVVLRSDYESAIDEMFDRCSSRHAPWYAVPFEQKAYGRIAALEVVLQRLGEGMDMTTPPLADDLVAAARSAGLLPAGDRPPRAKKK